MPTTRSRAVASALSALALNLTLPMAKARGLRPMFGQIVQMGHRGRVVMPAPYRDALGLQPGDDLVVTVAGQDARRPGTMAWPTDRPAATTARGRPAARRGHPPPPARGSAPAQPPH